MKEERFHATISFISVTWKQPPNADQLFETQIIFV